MEPLDNPVRRTIEPASVPVPVLMLTLPDGPLLAMPEAMETLPVEAPILVDSAAPPLWPNTLPPDVMFNTPPETLFKALPVAAVTDKLPSRPDKLMPAPTKKDSDVPARNDTLPEAAP